MAKLFAVNRVRLYNWGNNKQNISIDNDSFNCNYKSTDVLGYDLSSVIDVVNKTIDLNPEWKDKFIIYDMCNDAVEIKFLKQVIPDNEKPDEKYYHGRYEISSSNLLNINFRLSKVVPYDSDKKPEFKIIYELSNNAKYINTKIFNYVEEFEKILAEDIFAIAKIRITSFMNKIKENPYHKLDNVDIFRDKEISIEVMNILGL